MGKKKSKAKKLDRRFEMRLSERDFREFSKLADADGRSVADWLRRLGRAVVEAARRDQ